MPKVTRGYGFLEGFLAQQRANMANKLIPTSCKKGRVLDIGCGTYPFFLVNSGFSEKYGIDKVVKPENIELFRKKNIVLANCNIETNKDLPFTDCFFSVVTMLAVFEHIEPEKLVRLITEVYRVLSPGGIFIMTTPAPWSEIIISVMAKLRLISPEEIEEHKILANRSTIFSVLQQANFSKDNLRLGYFEMFLNTWATATK